MDIALQYESNRIYAQNNEGEVVAEITFPKLSDNTVNINRTFVHESLRGQGVADRLMQATAETVQSNNLKAVASCSYAVSWAAKHPEFADIFVDRDSCR